ncbi:hypothetical protein Tco_0029745, partial [Tanacetum coccineum]
MDLFAFIQVADPTKVKVGEWERAEEEAKNELQASVKRLFEEGGSAKQGDSAAGGGQEAETEIVTRVRIVTDEEKAQASTGDHEASSRVATSGKSQSILKELLARCMLNVEAGVAAVATLPMVTSLVSATSKHKSGVPADFITGLNLCTIGASERFVISSDSSHHSATNASRPEDDFIIRSVVISPMMTEAVVTSPVVCIPSVPEIGIKVTPLVHASMFHDSDSTKTVKADTASPSYSAKQDLSMGSRELNSETLRQVFVSQWNVLNDSLMDDYDVSREFVDHLSPPALFSQIHEMDYHHLFTEFNVGTAHQACLYVEVKMWTEYCLSERNRLKFECEKQVGLLKAKD